VSTIGKWVSLSCDWSDFQPNRKPSARTRNPYKQSLILIIDDDPTERLMARDALERADYRVIEAEDGPDGLAKAHTDKPDFIILDILMPVLDGFTVCDSLRHSKFTKSLPILIATGLDDEAAIQRGFDLGANDLMVKPINWDTLAHRVKYIMRNLAVESKADASQKKASRQTA
jgi:PleD family two-component response regulator